MFFHLWDPTIFNWKRLASDWVARVFASEKLLTELAALSSRAVALAQMRQITGILSLLILATSGWGASKIHVIALGKPTTVKIFVGPSEETTLSVAVRPLYLDDKLKEFTTGSQHDVTERLFVIRRAVRINDALPNDPHKVAKWIWQRAGWLLVDRSSGHITPVKLTDFDAFYSDVSWYRDYAAYCGISETNERLYAVVAQLGSRKPVFRKELGKSASEDFPDSECQPPQWERHPARVTFLPKRGEKLTVNVATRTIDEPVDNSGEQP